MSKKKAVRRAGETDDPELPSVGRSWSLAWRRALVQFHEHVPLLAGVVATAAVHGARSRFVPHDGSGWTQVVDLALLAATVSMGLTLVVGPAIRFVTELAEMVSVGKVRITHAWVHGRRLPVQVWEPGESEEAEP